MLSFKLQQIVTEVTSELKLLFHFSITSKKQTNRSPLKFENQCHHSDFESNRTIGPIQELVLTEIKPNPNSSACAFLIGVLKMPELKRHTESVEYGLAEIIWNLATDEQEKRRAIGYYEMACSKNDGAAFLALYKINHQNQKYLNQSIDLGYLPALLYAGTENIFLPYQRLVYLAAGMTYAHRYKLPELIDFQKAFASVSADFAVEFIPEILGSIEHWEPGKTISDCQSDLEGQLVQHPEKYEPKSDKKREGWKIFEDSPSTANYLNKLPGAREYFQACDGEDLEVSEDSDFLNQYQEFMEAARSQGNGQAMYALTEHKNSENLLNAAQHGSIDALVDIVNKLNDFFDSYKYGGKYEYSFYNTTRIETDEEEIFYRR